MTTINKYLEIQLIESFMPMIKGMETTFSFTLKKHFNEQEIKEILKLAQEHFDKVKTILPNVGSQSPWLKNMVGITYEIGLWKQLIERNMTLNEISVLTQETLMTILQKQVTPDAVKNIGAMMCSQTYVEKIANYSHLEEFPDDWIFDCVKPAVEDKFQIGMNIRKCPIGSLCESFNVKGFYPYLCINDYVTHSMLGIELKRTQTLAGGAGCCDFRLFYTGNSCATVITEPQKLEEFNKNQKQ